MLAHEYSSHPEDYIEKIAKTKLVKAFMIATQSSPRPISVAQLHVLTTLPHATYPPCYLQGVLTLRWENSSWGRLRT